MHAFKCTIGGNVSCQHGFRSLGGLAQHRNALHCVPLEHPPCPHRVTVEDVDPDEDSDSEEDQHNQRNDLRHMETHSVIDGNSVYLLFNSH